jgi:di/tricarboxylate transporter
MREVFEAVNDYPWTTFFVILGLIAIGNAFSGRNR